MSALNHQLNVIGIYLS